MKNTKTALEKAETLPEYAQIVSEMVAIATEAVDAALRISIAATEFSIAATGFSVVVLVLKGQYGGNGCGDEGGFLQPEKKTKRAKKGAGHPAETSDRS